MATGENPSRGKRPRSQREKASEQTSDAGPPRGRSSGHPGADAAGTATTPTQARSSRSRLRGGSAAARKDSAQSAGAAERNRSSRKSETSPADEAESGIDAGVDAALSGFFDSELVEEPEAGERESQAEPAAAFGAGRAEPQENLETDGPVMGGPGMIRTGADRAVSSGTGGLAAGEDLDPVAEGDYWRENFRRSPYSAAETESTYEPAYTFGWKKAGQFEYRNRGFEEVELSLREEWESSRGADRSWEQARSAVREAWHRAREREEGR
jgi:hypothetical protein